LILFALTGYRTTPIAILLSVFITLYYSKNIKIKYQIAFIFLISILLIAVGFMAAQNIEWQNWRLNPLELISYRAGFTLNILDRAIPLASSTNGELFYNTLTGFFKSGIDPRVLVGETILGKSHSITSTIFGPAILDFGLLGMSIQMFLIGFILKLLYMIQKYVKGIATAIYSLILAQTIIWIETGPTDFIVWLFYLLGIMIIIYYLYYLYSWNGGSIK
jgi:oligosaccharide repeat unit polymerase